MRVSQCMRHGMSSETNKRTYAKRIPGLVPVEGVYRIFGSFGKEHRATTVGGEGVSHDFVIPRVLQGPGALNGGVEVRGESNISVRVATRHVDSTEEAEVES